MIRDLRFVAAAWTHPSLARDAVGTLRCEDVGRRRVSCAAIGCRHIVERSLSQLSVRVDGMKLTGRLRLSTINMTCRGPKRTEGQASDTIDRQVVIAEPRAAGELCTG